VEKASPTGEFDAVLFRKEVMKLPPDTRNLLFSPQEIATMNKVASSNMHRVVKNLEKKFENDIFLYAKELGKAAANKTPIPAKIAVNRAVGKPFAETAVNTAQTLMPQQEGPLPRTVNGLGE
jgi:hypothetical protein